MSAPCYQCRAVKRCKMYLTKDKRPIYLCRKDATRLGYRYVDMVNVTFKIGVDTTPEKA